MDVDEPSPFESSEMLATFLASTPLLPESWRLCSSANAVAPRSFVTERIGGGGVYVAFSGIQMVVGSTTDASWGHVVPLERIGDLTVFPTTSYRNKEGEEPVKVHAGMLNLFCSVFTPFRNLMMEIIGNPSIKSIIITGHSLGGATASLCTLWLLSYLQSISSSSVSVLCITFGSPLLGNESFSKAILKERWGGNFCHVVSKHDIMPRLLFAPIILLPTQLNSLLQFWHLSMAFPDSWNLLGVQISEKEKVDFFTFVMGHLDHAATQDGEGEECVPPLLFHPFGSYFFVSDEGAVCVDRAKTVIKMMHLMLATSNSPACSIEDHLKYGDYVNKLSLQFLNQRNSMQGMVPDHSSSEAGLELALQSSGITSQDSAAIPFKECLRMDRRKGRTPTLNAAILAVTLSKFVPYRAEIEWYKAWCDKSDDQLGYYDSFKRRGSTRRDMKVNMNRHKLARFWNNVIDMLENNELPQDLDRREKWVNASHFYKLLVEPLDIAEYYAKGIHRIKGHYIENGRERRYKIFDRWWNMKEAREEVHNERSKFASLTQDSCFWAKVEEARDWLSYVRSESDTNKQAMLWHNIEGFEKYALERIRDKSVSMDVLAKNSSYSLWVEELREVRELKAKVERFSHPFPRFLDGEVVP